jgi:acetyl esterase/lipase
VQDQELTNQIDLRTPSAEKPKPPNFPSKDPLEFLMPLFDAYAQPARAENMDNPRYAPVLSDIDMLPDKMLLIVAGIDILAHEQLTFVERVKKDITDRGQDGKKRIECKVYDKGFHGWLECGYTMFSKTNVVGVNSVQCLFDYSKRTKRKYTARLLIFCSRHIEIMGGL